MGFCECFEIAADTRIEISLGIASYDANIKQLYLQVLLMYIRLVAHPYGKF